MIEIKKYEKFKSYKTVFAIFLITVLLSSAMGFMLFNRGTLLTDLTVEYISRRSFNSVFFAELILLIVIFLSGVTIYAPVSSFLSVASYGILMGSSFACSSDEELALLLIEIFFSTLIAYLLIIYSSFVTLTGLRIFSDVKKTGQRELFDGVLFRAEKFKGIFNFRYVASYIMFFLLFLALIVTATLFKLFLLSL